MRLPARQRRAGGLIVLAGLAIMLLVASACTGVEDTESTVEADTATSAATTAGAPETTETTIPTVTSCELPPEDPTTTTDPASSTETTAEQTTTEATEITAEPTTTTDPVVAAHQQTLTSLGYWLGPVDGVMGSNTAHAITAFQKVEGLNRTGLLDGDTVAMLAAASRPVSRSSGSGRVLEIDRSRQVLLAVTDGRVDYIFDISTGATATPTPTGMFSVYREIDGIREAPLGTLYRPKYFNGGIALHGYTSVPTQPASHGCVRLTYPAMDVLWNEGLAPVGTPVVVYD